MTVSAHTSIRPHSGATHPAIEPVRNVQNKRRAIGWQDCPVDEFLRLLSLHESGAINLLEMPETASDMAVADEPEEETTADDPTKRQSTGKQYNVDGVVFGKIYHVLSNTDRPLTTTEIADACGLTRRAIQRKLSSCPQFVHVGTRNAGAWTLKGREK